MAAEYQHVSIYRQLKLVQPEDIRLLHIEPEANPHDPLRCLPEVVPLASLPCVHDSVICRRGDAARQLPPETVTALIGLAEQDQPGMLIVADIRRDAIPPTLQPLHGDWVRWESIVLKAGVNREDGAVWLLLQKKVGNTSMTRVVIRERWLYFEEFVQNYPRATQAMRPVSERCFVAVQWEQWMTADWDEEQVGGVVDDDTELFNTQGDMDRRRNTIEQGATRACWYEKFGRHA